MTFASATKIGQAKIAVATLAQTLTIVQVSITKTDFKRVLKN
jgi:hypothetical protein